MMGIYALAKVQETHQCYSAQDNFDVDKPDLELRVSIFQIAKALWSMYIRYRSDVRMSDRYLMNFDPWICTKYVSTLKIESFHDVNCIAIGGTEDCHYNKRQCDSVTTKLTLWRPQCHQWWQISIMTLRGVQCLHMFWRGGPTEILALFLCDVQTKNKRHHSAFVKETHRLLMDSPTKGRHGAFMNHEEYLKSGLKHRATC